MRIHRQVLIGLTVIAVLICLAAPSTRNRGRCMPIKTQEELEEEVKQDQYLDKQIQRYGYKRLA